MAPLIKRPAPAFKATAVIDGQFREVSNEEYLGKWYAAPSFCGASKGRVGADKTSQGYPPLLSARFYIRR